MNNFDKSVLTYKFLSYMQLMSLFLKEHQKISNDNDEWLTDRNFSIGQRTYVSSTSGTEITSRLVLQIQYANNSVKLQIQNSWLDEDGLPKQKHIRAIQYNYSYPSRRASHAWISHLGASMYYGDYTDSTIVVSNEEVEVLTTAECNTLLQGSTEEMEFQYSTLLNFNDVSMIQYGILSLLTADNIRDTINITAPDLSMWEDSLAGMDEVLQKLREGILTND